MPNFAYIPHSTLTVVVFCDLLSGKLYDIVNHRQGMQAESENDNNKLLHRPHSHHRRLTAHIKERKKTYEELKKRLL